MDYLALEEIKKIEFDILTYFDILCKENNLKYSLSGGTLIGAVRHKGFIPWDDDVDVMMPRDDYEKLLKISPTVDKFKILKYTDGDYFYSFAKMIDTSTILIEDDRIEKNIGVYIDIFPIDTYSNENLKKLSFEKQRYLKKIGRLSFKSKKNFLKFLIKCVYSVFRKKRLKKLIAKFNDFAKNMSINNNELTCLFVADSFSKNNGFYGVNMFENGYIELEFEGKKFCSIKSYDEYLRSIYGDYMKLPPKEKQVSHHNFVAYKK